MYCWLLQKKQAVFVFFFSIILPLQCIYCLSLQWLEERYLAQLCSYHSFSLPSSGGWPTGPTSVSLLPSEASHPSCLSSSDASASLCDSSNICNTSLLELNVRLLAVIYYYDTTKNIGRRHPYENKNKVVHFSLKCVNTFLLCQLVHLSSSLPVPELIYRIGYLYYFKDTQSCRHPLLLDFVVSQQGRK